jgi:hypothetical protein
VLPLTGEKKPVPFPRTGPREGLGKFSPDGHWVAYVSTESGQPEIYVRSFSMNAAETEVEPGGKWQVSNGLALAPRWRSDGRELYYASFDGTVMAVEIETNPAFRAGKPHPLAFRLGIYFDPWDSAADGKRFLALAGTTGPESFTVVANWQTGLGK